MRKNGKNKKLALLVGMAMAFSAAYSVAPSDAFAANYNITYTSGDSDKWEAADENGTVSSVDSIAGITKLMTESGNNFTMSSETLAALKPTTSGEGGGSTPVTIAKDNTITVTTTNAGSVTYTSDGSATLGSSSDSKGELGGKFSTITVEGATGESAQVAAIKLAADASAENVTIASGKADINFAATNVTVAEGASLNVSDNKEIQNITLADGATLTTTNDKKLTTGKIEGTGNIDIKGVAFADNSTAQITSTGKVTAGAVGAGMGITGNGVEVSSVAAGATINAGAGDVSITGSAAFPTGDNAESKTTTITGNNITITGAVTDGTGKIEATGKLTLTGGFSSSESKLSNLQISADTIDLDKNSYDASKVTSDNIKANNLTTSGKVTIGENDTLPFTSVTAGDFENKKQSLSIDSLSVNGTYTNSGEVTVGTLKLGSSAKIAQNGQGSSKTNATINAKTIIIDTTKSTDSSGNDLATQLGSLTINGGDGKNDDVKIVLTGVADDADTSTITEAIAKAIYGNDVTDEQKAKLAANTTTTSSTGSADELSKAEEGVTEAKGKMQTYSTYTADEIQTKIANADPFSTKLPSLADLQAMTSADEQKNLEALNTAQKALYESQVAAGTLSQDDAAAKIAALPKTTAEQAEKIRAAVQNAGKTAAAPAVTSMRTANVVADVATTNVVNRTAELRSFVPSAESEEKPDNLWFQYKHSKIDVDNGDTYSKSTVKTNSYQLGYDAKVSETDIVGGYVGTTTGSSEFNGPARSGSVDIKNALDLGLYGTHMMTKGQYIDYMLHRNKFDNRTMGQTYGTTDLGAMLRYGVKIAQPNGLTLDPYIQLAYDKISVDSYQAGENTISSDDSNNFSTKIGLNLITTGGLYGGVAYSRGLSGSYSAYVNGIAMPTQDNDTNVIYLNLGYRAGIARDIFLDLSLEKTFCDYDGWNAAGKINFYF